jgi:hypothetical protein
MSDIAELFARDPMSLTHDEIEQIVIKLRSMRGQFNLGIKAAGSTKPKTEKQKEIARLGLNLEIDL